MGFTEINAGGQTPALSNQILGLIFGTNPDGSIKQLDLNQYITLPTVPLTVEKDTTKNIGKYSLIAILTFFVGKYIYKKFF